MTWNIWWVPLLVLIPAILAAWSSSEDRRARPDVRRAGGQLHFHSKRHMPAPGPAAAPGARKRHPIPTKAPRPRENRVVQTGNIIKPLEDEDIDNDEMFSVAIGPPPLRPKYEKSIRKPISKSHPDSLRETSAATGNVAVNLIKNVLSELSKEFLFKQTDENFIFGQYLGNAMKNLTKHLRLQMQHDVVDLILKYEKLNSSETMPALDGKMEKKVGKGNETEDSWADFSTLAKIVGG